jgi:hypothetical protein
MHEARPRFVKIEGDEDLYLEHSHVSWDSYVCDHGEVKHRNFAVFLFLTVGAMDPDVETQKRIALTLSSQDALVLGQQLIASGMSAPAFGPNEVDET